MNPEIKPKLIIVTGATASGKSAFLYEYAAQLPLCIINADSRQVYRDLVISSASPSVAERALFSYALYNFLPIDEAFSAGEFIRMARVEIERAHKEGNVPVICGGTYFYLHALLTGLLPAAQISDAIKTEIEALSGDVAYRQLQQLDSVAAEKIHPHNLVRVRRALMLCLTHGAPISAMAREGGVLDTHDILMLIFERDRSVLKSRAEERVRQMFQQGLVAEIQSVLMQFQNSVSAKHPDWRKVPALTGIGVREFFEAWETGQKMPQDLSDTELKSIEIKIILNTLHLIKRQYTWFRNAEPKPANTKTVDPSYENGRIATLLKEFARPPV